LISINANWRNIKLFRPYRLETGAEMDSGDTILIVGVIAIFAIFAFAVAWMDVSTLDVRAKWK